MYVISYKYDSNVFDRCFPIENLDEIKPTIPAKAVVKQERYILFMRGLLNTYGDSREMKETPCVLKRRSKKTWNFGLMVRVDVCAHVCIGTCLVPLTVAHSVSPSTSIR